jgi:hypothetical protein
MQQFKSLCRKRGGHVGHAGDVSTRSIEVRDKTCSYGIDSIFKDDRNRRRCGLRRKRGRCAARNNHLHLVPNEIGHECWEAIVAPIRKTMFESYISTFDISTFFQTLHERSHPVIVVIGRAGDEKTDYRQRRLPAHHNWSNRCPPEPRNELPPSHRQSSSFKNGAYKN